MFEPSTFIDLTIHLDEKGFATHVEGKSVTKSKWGGLFDKVNAKLKCDIQIPAKVRKASIVNGGRIDQVDKSEHSSSSDNPQAELGLETTNEK